jgi:HEXXH motif-containing protein
VNELEKACRGFSNPFEPFDESFLDAVVVTHAKEITRRFLERYAASVSRASDGIVPALERWLESEPAFEDAWDVAFGRLQKALFSGGSDDAVLVAAALTALRIAERGAAANWEARFRGAPRMRLGSFLLPAASRLQVSADGRRLYARVRRRRAWTWTVAQPARNDANLQGAERLTTVHAGSADILILRSGSPGVEPEIEHVVPHADPNSILPALETALRLIGRYSRPYHRWLRRLVRQILPLCDGPGMITSSTADWRPGVLYCANRPNPAALAEMLLHEGTHQYMYVLRRLGPLDDGSDSSLHYSPLSGQMRPLGTIVLAYHAAANITLFCRGCPSKSRLEPRRIENEFAESVAVYERILRRSRSLTPLGVALWKPLYERLRSVASPDINEGRRPDTTRRDAPGSYRSTTSRRTTGRRTRHRPSHRPGPAERTASTALSVR